MKSESFDLLIIDVMLPEGSGIDFCREVRRGGCEVPILVHSAAAGKSDIDAAVEAGANDYLVKPNGWTVLLETVQRLFQETREGTR
jgi:DNA-binding response OmpR family regulator